MGVCTCNHYKYEYRQLENIKIDELGKTNLQSSKTKQPASPSTVITNPFRTNTNNILKKLYSKDSEIEIQKHAKFDHHQSIIFNQNQSNIIIKKNFEKTILIYGDRESGKTSFSIKICEQKFVNYYIPSLSDEKKIKLLRLKPYSKKFKLEFNVTNNINEIKEADCYIILYDVTSLNSFIFAKSLIENKIFCKEKPIFLIGNKIDIGKKINIPYLQEFLFKYNCYFFYISLKESNGISLLLEKLGEILDYKEEIEIINN
jgi:GTPase SAR1 family protein